MRASASSATPRAVQLLAPTVEAVECLAALFASHTRAGDCYCLFGDVGAGKSVFSRAFIRAATRDGLLAVPSPTFLLQNTYDEHEGPPIHHFDFYRLQSGQDFERLSLAASFANAVCLMEWSERLQQTGQLPPERLAVRLQVQVAESSGPEAHSSSDALRCDAGAGADSSAVAGSSSPRTEAQEEGEDEGGLDEYTDRRARLITLDAEGQYWASKLHRVVAYVDAHAADVDGLRVLAGR